MKRTGIVLVCTALIIVVSYVSAAAGYLVGGPQYSARFTPADAAYTVVVLKALRRGDSESAISLLETDLDSQIIKHSTFSPRVASWLDVCYRHTEATDKLMARVAAYRSQHLSEAPADVLTAINAHLAAFQ